MSDETLNQGHRATLFHGGTGKFYKAVVLHAMTPREVWADMNAGEMEGADPQTLKAIETERLVLISEKELKRLRDKAGETG
jgi:hypothetical protein